MTRDEWLAGAPERERDLALESANRERAKVGLAPLPPALTPEERRRVLLANGDLERNLDAIWGPT